MGCSSGLDKQRIPAQQQAGGRYVQPVTSLCRYYFALFSVWVSAFRLTLPGKSLQQAKLLFRVWLLAVRLRVTQSGLHITRGFASARLTFVSRCFSSFLGLQSSARRNPVGHQRLFVSSVFYLAFVHADGLHPSCRTQSPNVTCHFFAVFISMLQ